MKTSSNNYEGCVKFEMVVHSGENGSPAPRCVFRLQNQRYLRELLNPPLIGAGFLQSQTDAQLTHQLPLSRSSQANSVCLSGQTYGQFGLLAQHIISRSAIKRKLNY